MSISRANRAIVWSLFAVAVLVNVAGAIFVLKEKLWWFDEAAHACFFFSLALVVTLYAYGPV